MKTERIASDGVTETARCGKCCGVCEDVPGYGWKCTECGHINIVGIDIE